jgi:hypothetical protein
MKTIIIDIINVIKDKDSDNEIYGTIKSIKSLKICYNIIFITMAIGSYQYHIINWLKNHDLCNTPILFYCSEEDKIAKIKKYNGYILIDNDIYFLEKLDNFIKKIFFNEEKNFEYICDNSIIKIKNWTNLYDYLFSLYINDNLLI